MESHSPADSNGPSLRVAVKHRLPVVSAGIVAMLGAHPNIRLVAGSKPAEVVVTDYEDALAAASKRTSGQNEPRLLIFTETDREDDVKTALRAGISGYVLYDCAPEELTAAVVALGRGDRHFCAKAVDRMADSLTHDELTPRELDVLSLMIKGFSNKLIARELDVSIGTVKAHANAVYGKLNASSRLHAAAIAVARGIDHPRPSAPRPHPTSEAARTRIIAADTK